MSSFGQTNPVIDFFSLVSNKRAAATLWPEIEKNCLALRFTFLLINCELAVKS